MADVLEEGENAFLFDPGDEHGCSDAIVRAASASDAALERMGQRAFDLAVERCDARRETLHYIEVLESLRPVALTAVDES
jgi:hypothetical protein